ncbi:MAG TPA: VCBS domain-containing protein, partial [Gemmatimonadales bacterium]|nr:VCBS domain-containing protein [Gemmatimonadales bacterium]
SVSAREITASTLANGYVLTAAQVADLKNAFTIDAAAPFSSVTGQGSVAWSYAVADGALDFLGANDSVTLTFTVLVEDGNGGTTSQDVIVTVTGTNDQPVIGVADATGAVTERADLSAGENTGDLTTAGAIAFSDEDLSDSHTVSAVLVSATDSAAGAVAARGTFTPVIADGATSDGSGSVSWTFSVPAGALDDLAEGQTLTQVYTVIVTDSAGSTAAQTVTVTLTGTNDAPVLHSTRPDLSGPTNATPGAGAGVTVVGIYAAGSDVNVLEGLPPLVTANNYVPTNSIASSPVSFRTGYNYMGSDTWFSDHGINRASLAGGTIVFSDGTTGLIDILSDGVPVELSYVYYRPYDPTLPSQGKVTEIADNASGEGAAALATSGQITFTDVDLIDTHTVAFTPNASGYRGAFAANLAHASTGDGLGVVAWSFTVPDAAVEDLAAGETLTQVYTVTITDSSGAVLTQPVTITIVGRNDGPTIVGGDFAGAMTEDSSSPNLTEAGVFTFRDLDLSNSHTVSISAPVVTTSAGVPAGFAPAAGFGALAASLVENTADADNTGQIAWSFAAANAAVQGLAAGETVTQVYTLTITDSSGASVTQTVTITLTGTNDVPTLVAGGDAADGVVEASSTATLSDSGSFQFQDLDLSNTHTVSVGAPSISAAGVPAGFVPAGGFGVLTASVSENTADLSNIGTVDWSFEVNDAAIQGLAAGQVVTQTYVLTIADSSGTTVTRNVTITLTGTNDVPTIFAASDVNGAATEDATTPSLTDAGSFTFEDLDLSDTHTVSVGAAA